jgi:predicted HicB family RNase H-like nuclease
MAVPKANQRAVHKYVKSHYDRYDLTMPKGKKAELQAHATAHGESLNGFVNRAIDETIDRDNAPEVTTEA